MLSTSYCEHVKTCIGTYGNRTVPLFMNIFEIENGLSSVIVMLSLCMLSPLQVHTRRPNNSWGTPPFHGLHAIYSRVVSVWCLTTVVLHAVSLSLKWCWYSGTRSSLFCYVSREALERCSWAVQPIASLSQRWLVVAPYYRPQTMLFETLRVRKKILSVRGACSSPCLC